MWYFPSRRNLLSATGANSSGSGTGEAHGLPAPSRGARAGRLRSTPALRDATLALAFALAFPAALGKAFALAFAFTLGGIAFAFVCVSGRGLIRCRCLSCKACCLTLFPPFSPLFTIVFLFSRPLTLCSWRYRSWGIGRLSGHRKTPRQWRAIVLKRCASPCQATRRSWKTTSSRRNRRRGLGARFRCGSPWNRNRRRNSRRRRSRPSRNRSFPRQIRGCSRN